MDEVAQVKSRPPRALQVEALEPYKLLIKWDTGEALEVDVEEQLRSIPAFAPILAPEVFKKVHIAEWGGSIEWLDTEFGDDNVYAWTREQMGEASHEMFLEWMRRNNLSLTAAAEADGDLLPHGAKAHSQARVAGLPGLGAYAACRLRLPVMQ